MIFLENPLRNSEHIRRHFEIVEQYVLEILLRTYLSFIVMAAKYLTGDQTAINEFIDKFDVRYKRP